MGISIDFNPHSHEVKLGTLCPGDTFRSSFGGGTYWIVTDDCRTNNTVYVTNLLSGAAAGFFADTFVTPITIKATACVVEPNPKRCDCPCRNGC